MFKFTPNWQIPAKKINPQREKITFMIYYDRKLKVFHTWTSSVVSQECFRKIIILKIDKITITIVIFDIFGRS